MPILIKVLTFFTVSISISFVSSFTHTVGTVTVDLAKGVDATSLCNARILTFFLDASKVEQAIRIFSALRWAS